MPEELFAPNTPAQTHVKTRRAGRIATRDLPLARAQAAPLAGMRLVLEGSALWLVLGKETLLPEMEASRP